MPRKQCDARHGNSRSQLYRSIRQFARDKHCPSMGGAALKDILRFSIATVTYYWRRSLLLTLCVAMSVFVPLTPFLLVRRAATTLEQRAASTPLMLAAAGSKTDVTLSALYFDGRKHTKTIYVKPNKLTEYCWNYDIGAECNR